MPTDDLPEIDQEQSTRIYRMAMASRYLKSRSNVESASIMYEVNQDYARTMNKIIMDKTLEKTPEELEGMIPANLTLPDKPRPKPVPYYGQVPIPPHDFPDSLSNFNFSSLYIKEETIRAMVEIRGLCNELMTKRIFDTSQKNMQRIDEFKMIQSGSISQFESDCGENGWVGNLARIIKTHFDDVGKGWFNIHEKSKSTYEFGKLKKFLTLVNFMMQDTVLNICKDSIKEFVAYILGMCPIDT
jgi:dynein heavy chain